MSLSTTGGWFKAKNDSMYVRAVQLVNGAWD